MRHADGCDVMMNRVMTKDNIALAVLLETREPAWETQPQPDQVHGVPESVISLNLKPQCGSN
jgi:hypothetical protein